jgi:hypothetical protein
LHCPFDVDGSTYPYLRPARAREIADALYAGKYFRCHKTTEAGGVEGGLPIFCTGAIATLEAEGVLGHNQAARIAMRLGMFDPDAIHTDNVPGSLEDWVEDHENA